MTRSTASLMFFALIPVLAAAAGAVIAALRQPSAALRSGLQHFAAGVVFSVVGVELLPDILREHKPIHVIIGFTLGIAALLVLRSFGPSENPSESGPRKAPVAFLCAVGIDLLIDGFLIGIGFAAGAKEGKLLTFALTVELFSLGVATAVTLMANALPRRKSVEVTSAVACCILLGAGLGGTLLRNIPDTYMEIVLSFGLAALLFVVVEELLVEAHEVPETPLITSSFFAGFLLFLVFGMVI